MGRPLRPAKPAFSAGDADQHDWDNVGGVGLYFEVAPPGSRIVSRDVGEGRGG